MGELQAYYKLQTRALNSKIMELKQIVCDQQEDLNDQKEELEVGLAQVKEEFKEIKGLASEIDVLSHNSQSHLNYDSVSDCNKLSMISSIQKGGSLFCTSFATRPAGATIKSPESKNDPSSLSTSQSMRSLKVE